MIYNNIDKMIMRAVKNHDDIRTATLRLIKAKFIEYRTSKGALPIDEAIEISILNKMVKMREESSEMYISAGRLDQAQKEIDEITIIKEYLPAPVTEDQIIEEFNAIVKGGLDPIKKNMGMFIKTIKQKYPNADGKMTSQIVSKNLN